MKQLLIEVLKACPYVGALLYNLCVPSGFGGRARFDVHTSHVFPQGAVAAITLVGGGAGARCDLGLLLCSVANTTLLGTGTGPKLLE